MAQIVRQARRVDQVRVTPECGPEFAPDLRALQRVGEPGAREVSAPTSTTWVLAASLRNADECSTLARSRMNGPRWCAAGGTLVRLGCPARGGVGVVARGVAHLLSLPPTVSRRAARPASSLATGTRKGEQDT